MIALMIAFVLIPTASGLGPHYAAHEPLQIIANKAHTYCLTNRYTNMFGSIGGTV